MLTRGLVVLGGCLLFCGCGKSKAKKPPAEAALTSPVAKAKPGLYRVQATPDESASPQSYDEDAPTLPQPRLAQHYEPVPDPPLGTPSPEPAFEVEDEWQPDEEPEAPEDELEEPDAPDDDDAPGEDEPHDEDSEEDEG